MALNASDPDRNALAAVKAVSAGYPLRGTMRLSASPAEPKQPTRADPAGRSGLGRRATAAGDRGASGRQPQARREVLPHRSRDRHRAGSRRRLHQLRAARDDQSGRPAGHPADHRRQPGDLSPAGRGRATGRCSAFATALERDLPRGQRLESLESGRPEMQRTLERAQRFLALVALLAAMIAAVAVAAAARRFSQRHLDSCAMMRCLGLAADRHLPALRARVRRDRRCGLRCSAWRSAMRRTSRCWLRWVR